MHRWLPVLLVCTGPLFLLAATPPLILDGSTIRESYAGSLSEAAGPGFLDLGERMKAGVMGRTTLVSGRRIVGVMTGPFQGPADLGRLQILLPEVREPQPICFSATTRDGFYSAVGSLSAPAGSRGAARIRFESRLRAELARYRTSDLAVRTAIGRGCAATPTPSFLVASYGAAPLVLKLMVQSRGALSVRAVLSDSAGRSTAAECAREPGKVSRAFDMECDIDARLLRRSGRSALRLDVRNRSGTTSTESADLLWVA
jgi:hypothetical protein